MIQTLRQVFKRIKPTAEDEGTEEDTGTAEVASRRDLQCMYCRCDCVSWMIRIYTHSIYLSCLVPSFATLLHPHKYNTPKTTGTNNLSSHSTNVLPSVGV